MIGQKDDRNPPIRRRIAACRSSTTARIEKNGLILDEALASSLAFAMATFAPQRSYRHWKYSPSTPAIPSLLFERERLGNGRAIHAALQGHRDFMRRLVVDATLHGHDGCVNHLRWNQQGTLLASGSDDTRLIVWDYATKQPREVVETGHRLNIFAVCFVPGTHDHIIATGAMDNEVRIHYAPFRRDATKCFRLHTGRVKDLASSPGVPRVFWSVAEDGLVYQFDVRALPQEDGSGTSRGDGSGVLIRLGKARSGGEVRGMAMAVHPLDSTKVAVACGDFYTRMYDRRMLRTQPHSTRRRSHGEAAVNEQATVPVELFAPPHLHMDAACSVATRRRHEDCHGTSIQFSSDGSELLANYHNDHIYLFRLHHRECTDGGVSPPSIIYKSDGTTKPVASTPATVPDWMYGIKMDCDRLASRTLTTRSDLQARNSRGLVALLSKDYKAALECFTQLCGATELATMSDSFRKDVYHNTAKVYLGRAWRADHYIAAQYARLAETLDPVDREVKTTLIEALGAGKRYRHVVVRTKQYQDQYPDHYDDVAELAQRATARLGPNRDRRLRVVRRRSDDESSGGDPDDDDREYDDGDDPRSSSSSSSSLASAMSSSHSEGSDEGELHVEEELIPSDTDNAGDLDENDEASFWKSPLHQQQRVTCDVAHRYIGYCNLQTDIKEATFFGPNDECIVAGSDDGKAYIWHKATGKLLNAIDADADIVNCVQPHPIDTCLATSGIENVIRLWKPTGDEEDAPSEDDLERLVATNQDNMADSPSDSLHGANANLIRLIFHSNYQQGGPECTTN